MKRYLTLILVLLFSVGILAGCEQLNSDLDERTDPALNSPNNDADSESANADALKAAKLEFKELTALSDQSPEEIDSYLEALTTIDKNSLDFAEKTLAGDSSLADKNYIYSPISTWLCYELLLGGTSGDLAEELKAKLEANHFAEDSKLDNLSIFANYCQSDDNSFNIQNLLLISDQLNFKAEYLDYAANFRPLLYQMDLSRTDELTAALNKLIDEKTAGLIPEFYKEDLNPEIISILMNITTLDARWETEFMPEDTAREEFTKSDGSSVTVDMMNQTAANDMRYAEDDYAQYLRKAYLSGTSMILILPKDDVSPQEALRHFQNNSEKITFESYRVELKLPKFTIESNYDLKELLSKIGLEELFSPKYGSQIDLLVEDQEIFIKSSKQAAKIEVFEEGSKAAAVTTIDFEGASIAAAEDFIALHFNRPFAFVIKDPQEICLFEAVVMDPSE
ncbi:MAG: serpin family protein [Eubacteriales bacterium]|nr:serpin family protein [Eubacteriales bacterium]